MEKAEVWFPCTWCGHLPALCQEGRKDNCWRLLQVCASRVTYRISCPVLGCTVFYLKVWNSMNLTAAFNKSSFSRDLYLTFKSNASQIRCQSSYLSLLWLLDGCFAWSSVNRWPKEWTSHGIMQKECVGVCKPSPRGARGRQWQLLVGLGSPGELRACLPWSQHPACLLLVARACWVLVEMVVQRVVHSLTFIHTPLVWCGTWIMKTRLQILGCIMQPRTLELVLPSQQLLFE